MKVEHAELEGICKGLAMITKDMTDFECDLPAVDIVYLRDGANRILDIVNKLRESAFLPKTSKEKS